MLSLRVICGCCCCCSAYLSSCHRTASDAKLLDDPHAFHHQDYFVIGGIRTCLGVSDDPMFLWISSNSYPLNLLLVRSHQAEIIIVKRLIQGRNNVTRVRVEPRSFDQGRRKNDAFTVCLPPNQKSWLRLCSRLSYVLYGIKIERVYVRQRKIKSLYQKRMFTQNFLRNNQHDVRYSARNFQLIVF